jgi:hypothetical protein
MRIYKLFLFLILFISGSYLVAQTPMLDTTKQDKVGNKKNGFFIEGAGSSSLAGVYYERFILFGKNPRSPFQIRVQGGFSPFTFLRFSFSDGVSIPMGVNFVFLPNRFKIGIGMMFLHSFFFNPIQVEDHGYSPIKITNTSYKLFLQPQLIFEYHFSQRLMGKLTFNPTFMPGLTGGKTSYSFMPWGGISVGYKF